MAWSRKTFSSPNKKEFVPPKTFCLEKDFGPPKTFCPEKDFSTKCPSPQKGWSPKKGSPKKKVGPAKKSWSQFWNTGWMKIQKGHGWMDRGKLLGLGLNFQLLNKQSITESYYN